MVLPYLKNFTVTPGEQFDYRFQWNQGVPENGIPTNLALYNASLVIVNYNNTLTYRTLVSGATPGASGIFYGGATHDPSNGVIDIILIGADTATLAFKTARYKMTMTPVADSTAPLPLLYGTFSVITLVT